MSPALTTGASAHRPRRTPARDPPYRARTLRHQARLPRSVAQATWRRPTAPPKRGIHGPELPPFCRRNPNPSSASAPPRLLTLPAHLQADGWLPADAKIFAATQTARDATPPPQPRRENGNSPPHTR